MRLRKTLFLAAALLEIAGLRSAFSSGFESLPEFHSISEEDVVRIEKYLFTPKN